MIRYLDLIVDNSREIAMNQQLIYMRDSNDYHVYIVEL
jgi:hypothetical protein